MSTHRILLERHSKNLSIQKGVMSSLSKVVPCLGRSSVKSVRALLGVLIPIMVHTEGKGVSCLAARIVAAVLKMESQRELKSEMYRMVEEMGWKVVEEPLKEAAMDSAVTDSKIRSRRQDALDAGSSVFDTVSLCADDADAAGGRLLRAVHPASASEGLDDPASTDICHGVWRPQSCLRSKQRRPVEERNGRRDSPRSLQHVDGTPTDSRELSLAFVETVYAGLARLQDQDRTLSLETLSYILPCLLMK